MQFSEIATALDERFFQSVYFDEVSSRKGNDVRTELMRRVQEHERSLSRVIEMKGRATGGNAMRLELNAVLASEAAARNDLIDWEAPTTTLAIEKLLHLLAHVLAGQIAFDEDALAKIKAQSRRFQSDVKN